MKITKGFTLIEVLVSTFVLSVGLLGLAALQVTGLRNNLSAYTRSQSTQLAYDISDKMRANIIEAQNFAGSIYVTIAPEDATEKANCKAIVGNCTPADMAEHDLWEWNTELMNLLPSGSGTITVAPPTYKVAITWDDNRDDVVNGDDPNFEMSFQL